MLRSHEVVALNARHGGVTLAGSLWLPAGDPTALLVMHPGSGPSDRNNDVFFPPICAALLDAGIAAASFDKRGVGDSDGSWLDAGIEEQAGDLLAGVTAAAQHLPSVTAGVFGHSQGGWVVLEATRRSHLLGNVASIDLAITSSGPAVTVGEQERFSMQCTLARLDLRPAERRRAAVVIDMAFALAESGASHAELLMWAAESDHAALLTHTSGGEIPDRPLWDHLVKLFAFDPVPALRALRVPLLAVFGALDDVTPVDSSVAALRSLVDPPLLEVAVLPDGGHRLARPRETDFVAGYPDVVIDFVHRRRR